MVLKATNNRNLVAVRLDEDMQEKLRVIRLTFNVDASQAIRMAIDELHMKLLGDGKGGR
jgi:antitoxin component of RelBE/YafQ-DinJ toxin-antitoxin module